MLSRSIAFSIFVGAAFYVWFYWFSAEAKKNTYERHYVRDALSFLIIPGVMALVLLPFHFYNDISFLDIATGNMQWPSARKFVFIAYGALTTSVLGLLHSFIIFLFRK